MNTRQTGETRLSPKDKHIFDFIQKCTTQNINIRFVKKLFRATT